jgi:hypothetical protein
MQKGLQTASVAMPIIRPGKLSEKQDTCINAKIERWQDFISPERHEELLTAPAQQCQYAPDQ